MEVVAFMEVAAQCRDMLCLGQCERAFVLLDRIRAVEGYVYPAHAYRFRAGRWHACTTLPYPPLAFGHTCNQINQPRYTISAAESNSGLTRAASEM